MEATGLRKLHPRARAVVHGIWNDLEAGCSEAGHRSRHVTGRGYQKPLLFRPWPQGCGALKAILAGVSGPLLHLDPLRRCAVVPVAGADIDSVRLIPCTVVGRHAVPSCLTGKATLSLLRLNCGRALRLETQAKRFPRSERRDVRPRSHHRLQVAASSRSSHRALEVAKTLYPTHACFLTRSSLSMPSSRMNRPRSGSNMKTSRDNSLIR